MKLTLTLTDQERYNLEGFLEKHGGCTESDLTLESDNSSGVGRSLKAICQCGEDKDITDYDVW
jgi:hypothetical protein